MDRRWRHTSWKSSTKANREVTKTSTQNIYIYIYICVSKKRHSREHILPWMKFYFSIDVTSSMFEVKEGLDLRNDSRHLCFHEFLEKFLTNTSKRDSIQNHRLKMLSCFKHHLVIYIEYISIQLKVSWKQYHEKLSTGVKHDVRKINQFFHFI